MSYKPPFTVEPRIIDLIAEISEVVGRLTVYVDSRADHVSKDRREVRRK